MILKIVVGTVLIGFALLTSVFPGSLSLALAERGVEIPALAVMRNSPNEQGVFSVQMVWWDEKSEPNPISIQYGSGTVNSFQYGRLNLGRTSQQSTLNAFEYAIKRTPDIQHTGTINLQGIAYGSARFDGPSAGAVMAVGFIALLRGDTLERGVAMTGTLERHGMIGSVGGLRGKIQAAAREGYHLILIPEGQLHDSRWDIRGLELELNVTVKEVGTIDEAYELMTGVTL